MNNEPAFPYSTVDGHTVQGLTKLEYFAIQLMPIYLKLTGAEEASRGAINAAEELIQQLERRVILFG